MHFAVLALILISANPEPPGVPTVVYCPMMTDTSTEINITVTATEPRKRDISFQVDWGDGTIEWSRALPSNAEIEQYHTYRTAGTMKIRVRASRRDLALGDTAASGWSKPCSVLVRPCLYKWVFPLPNGTFSSPALDSAGNIYFGDDDGIFYSLTPEGKLRWRFTAGDAISAAVAISGNNVFFPCEDAHLYCLNRDGELVWKYRTATAVVAGPAVSPDGMVYCADDSGVVYALNNQGFLRWSHVTHDEVNNGLTIGADGTVYVASDSVYAFSATGKRVWTQGGQEEDSPFYGVSIGPDNQVYAGNMDGNLYRFDAKTGRILWRAPATDEDEIHGEAVFGPNNEIYFGCDGYYLNVKPQDGAPRELFEAEDRIRTTPAVSSKGTIYLHAQDGQFYSLTPEGKVRWKRQIGSGDFDWIPSSPVIAPDGTVYVGSFENGLYAFYGDAPPLNGKWSMFRGTAQHTGRLPKR